MENPTDPLGTKGHESPWRAVWSPETLQVLLKGTTSSPTCSQQACHPLRGWNAPRSPAFAKTHPASAATRPLCIIWSSCLGLPILPTPLGKALIHPLNPSSRNTFYLCLVRLSGLSVGLWTKGLLVQFPVRAHIWAAGQVPSRGRTRDNHTLTFLSLSFPSPLKTKRLKK